MTGSASPPTSRPVHGSPDHGELERLGLSPDDLLDFSVNVNAYGPSPQVLEVVRQAPVDRYPDSDALALRRAIARQTGVPAAEVLVGNGAAEVIWLLAHALLRPGDTVLVVGPTFGEYRRAAEAAGAGVVEWRATAEDGFTVDVEEVDRLLAQRQAAIAFVCSPNNPTGGLLPADTIDRWARRHPGTLFVVDEAYLAFAEAARSAIRLRRRNVAVLRSMTKDYAIAGLRLGYLLAREDVVEAVNGVRPPWNVNALALAAGVAALSDPEHLEASMAALRRAKPDLVDGLRSLGLRPHPSAVHYLVVDVGDGAAFRRALLERGILVRDCASFGLPRHVRLATRLPHENARLLAALAGAL